MLKDGLVGLTPMDLMTVDFDCSREPDGQMVGIRGGFLPGPGA